MRLPALLIPAFLLAGCAEEGAFDPMADDAAAPPGSLTLRVSPMVPGQPVTLTVTGADANQVVDIYRSTGVTPRGSCGLAGLGASCLDLTAPATRTFRLRANGAGTATTTVTLPNPLALSSVAWQAAYRNAGGFDSSVATLYTVHQPTSDADFDGLTAAVEVGTWGSDPGDGDSDGGGAADGLETRLGTSPTDPADDTGIPTYTANIAPLLSANCTGCHSGPNPSGGHAWTSYNNLLVASSVPGLNEIQPGEPGRSYLFHKVKGTQASVGGGGSRMPLGGQLSGPQQQLIADWILGGAVQ